MPRTLRQALSQIQTMLDGKSFSLDLWNILVALRGPDSRDKKLKYATTAVIRSAAFPKKPCSASSVFGRDTKKLVERRRKMFLQHEDFNHFREHVSDAFTALGLELFEVNHGKRNRRNLGRK